MATNFKHLFKLTKGINKHFCPHSNHAWPDASLEGQKQVWVDASIYLDKK